MVGSPALHCRWGLRKETRILFVSAQVLPTSLEMLLLQLVCCHSSVLILMARAPRCLFCAYLESHQATPCPTDKLLFPRGKNGARVFASRWEGLTQSLLKCKALAAARELGAQLLFQPDTSSKIAPSHLPDPISDPEEGFYGAQLSFPPALNPLTQH